MGIIDSIKMDTFFIIMLSMTLSVDDMQKSTLGYHDHTTALNVLCKQCRIAFYASWCLLISLPLTRQAFSHNISKILITDYSIVISQVRCPLTI